MVFGAPKRTRSDFLVCVCAAIFIVVRLFVDLTICKSFLVVWDENGLFIWFIVIDGKFDNSVPEYDVLQYSPNPPTSVVITVRDHKLGRMVEKELTIVNRNGQMVLLSSPVSGKSGNCIALNFTFDDQGTYVSLYVCVVSLAELVFVM